MTKREEKTAATRRKIVDAAVDVLERKAFHECLMEDIARAAGVGKGTVYLYFESKEDLYVSLLVRLVEDMRAIVDEVRTAPAPSLQQLRDLVHRLYDFTAEHAHILLLAREQAKPGKGKLRERLRQAYDDLLLSMSAVVEKSVREGGLKNYPPLLVSALFFSMLTSVARFRKREGPGTPAISPGLIADILLHGIAMVRNEQ